MIIVCIDFLAAMVLSFGAFTLVWYAWLFHRPDADPPAKAVWVVPAMAYVYLTVIARSRIRSLGYLLTDTRIVDIRGGRPSLLQMTVRLLPLLPVPWSLLLDLGWIMDEPQRQTLRDKWAGTYVVRQGTKPISTAPIHYKRIAFGGIFLIFPEVGQPDQAAQPPC